LDRISSLVKTACFVDGASLTKDQQALLQRAVDARGFCMKMQGECDPGDLTGTVWTQAVHDGQGQRWYAAVVAGGAQGRDYVRNRLLCIDDIDTCPLQSP
jgi:hypothetical protein